MSGSAMLGNCCVGSSRMATAPAMVIRMAMTMATIGRLMKNFDMSVAPGCPLRCRGSPWPGNYRNASGLHQFRRGRRDYLQLLDTLDHYALARLHSGSDKALRPEPLHQLHRSVGPLALRSDHDELVVGLHLEHGGL